MTAPPALLRAEAIEVAFGSLQAVDGVSLDVRAGEIVGIIGPNGSGKTTLVNAICGTLKPKAGRVVIDDTEITGWPSHQVARRGVARTFQHFKIFPTLTAFENVRVGAEACQGAGLVAQLLRTKGNARAERASDDVAWEQLELVGLADRADVLAGELIAVESRLLQIARALASRPRLLILDEAASGLTDRGWQQLIRTLRVLNERDLTVLFIEHNIPFTQSLSHRLVAMDAGRVIAEGTSDEVLAHDDVRRAYLGTRTA